jgi:hypothetical protein
MMNVKRMIALCALGLVGAVGCGDEVAGNGSNGTVNGGNGTGGNGTNGAIDAGTEPDAAAIVDAGGAPDATADAGAPDAQGPVCEPPSGGFGTREGSNFAPFAGVTYCDGASFDFYGESDGFCDAELTVLIRSAEWCGPCQLEAREIGRGALDEYANAGVRFITVMDQNQDFNAPTRSTCENWERTFGLDDAAINHRMLMDPGQEVSVYFPPGQSGYPGNVIVDSEGRIIRRILGVDLDGLKQVIDSLLAE